MLPLHILHVAQHTGMMMIEVSPETLNDLDTTFMLYMLVCRPTQAGSDYTVMTHGIQDRCKIRGLPWRMFCYYYQFQQSTRRFVILSKFYWLFARFIKNILTFHEKEEKEEFFWGVFQVCPVFLYSFSNFLLIYSRSPRNRNRINRNHLDQSLSVPQKNRNSLTWVLVALTACFTYPVLYRVSAESRAGEWEFSYLGPGGLDSVFYLPCTV